jgi:glycosyltransferase involved in cell wall biosynthesis
MTDTSTQADSIRSTPRVVIIGSGRPVTCAVMDYAQRLVNAMNAKRPGYAEVRVAEPDAPLSFIGAMQKPLAAGQILHLQLPIEGWGNSVVPGSAAFAARALSGWRGRLVLTLHEWASLHPLRYLSMIPNLAATSRFVFVSEAQRAAFQSAAWISAAKRRAAPIIPIGPNIMPPSIDATRRDAERIRLTGEGPLRAELVVGFFGVLYASKRPELLLQTLRALHDRGVKARLLVCGDFLLDKPQDRAAFFALAAQLDVTDWLDFRGRIDDERELLSTLAAADVFLLPYTDGISTRRGSFQAIAPLAIPLVSTEAENTAEFAASPLIARKIDSPATVLKPRDGAPGEFADGVVEAHAQRAHALSVDLSSLWAEAADAHFRLYDSL